MLNNCFDFCFHPNTVVFSVSQAVCLLEGYAYNMEASPSETPDGDYTICSSDFSRLLSTLCPGKASPDSRQPAALIHTLKQQHGFFFFRDRNLLIFRKEDFPPTEEEISLWIRRLRRSSWGEQFRLCWFAPAKRLLPFRLYLPRRISSSEQLPLIVILHGGGSSPDEIFDVTHHEISFMAEAKRFIVLAPDSCIRNSTYGCPIPPQGLLPDSGFFRDTEHSLKGKELSEQALKFIIDLVADTCPVKKDSLCLAGNSMGGLGTFYFASTHPGLFRAIAPAAAAPDMSLFDPAPLRGLPIYFTAGTRDHHGYCHLEKAYRAMKEQGLSITLDAVPQGFHGTAWAENLEEWINFLLANA